ncbi:MAG TPA: hypothetical protein DHV48_17705 [Prolixibacteraceae bacterium]|nr:hypothetical protein [Prolixibacteraceae bacterium]
MKTSGFTILIILLISCALMAQTKLNFQADSVAKGIDTLNFSQFQYDLIPDTKKPKQLFPKSKQFQTNPNLALKPRQKIFPETYFNMPISKPQFQSDMPVMKPDSTIHFHLLIKRGSQIK